MSVKRATLGGARWHNCLPNFNTGLGLSIDHNYIIILDISSPFANNESSEVIDILLPLTFYFNPSTRLDNVKNL